MKTEIFDFPNLNNIYYDSQGNLLKNFGKVVDCYTCFRPVCSGENPCIKKYNSKGKNIICNYGHGGGGWTLNWGSVMKSLDLINIESLKNENVAIIGSGILGLSTASYLINQGVCPKRICIYTKSLDITTTASFGSGAIFSSMVTSGESRPDFNEIILDTFKFWSTIKKAEEGGKGRHIFPWEKIAKHFYLLDLIVGADKSQHMIETSTGTEVVIEAGLLPETEIINMKFKNSWKEYKVKKAKTYYFQIYYLLKEMIEILSNLGVNLIEKEVKEAESLSENTIFNCTGYLGSSVSQCIQEKSLPLTGHMIHLKTSEEDNKKNLDYIIITPYKETPTSDTEYLIYMPKKGPGFDFVLGGTKIKNYYGGNKKYDMENYKRILYNMKKIYGLDVNEDENLKDSRIPTPKF